MKQKWQEISARFDVLAMREKALVSVAILVGGLFLGYSFLIEPQIIREANQAKRIAQVKLEIDGVEAQLAATQTQKKDPDATNRAALQEVRKNMAAIDTRLHSIQDSLVPPDKMQAFLAALLSKNRGLEVLSLRTLPATALVERAEAKKEGKQDALLAKGANIYKHGVEIRLAGKYNDLLSYLAEMESMPQRIIWSRAELSVEEYPRSVLLLTVYTLSLDRKWLVV